MEINLQMLSEASAVLASVGVVGGALLWIFREKVRDWVRAQTKTHRDALEARMTSLEDSHANHEGELMRIAETMERTSENMNDSFKRLTVSLERIVDRHEETSLAVARIEGALERRKPKP